VKKIIILAVLFLGKIWAEEMIPLDKLKEGALRNNVRIRMAEEAVEVFTAESSILNNIRASASYNFETDTYFYGVTGSIPFGFFTARRCAMGYKRFEVERTKEEVFREIEDLYLRYILLSKEIGVYKTSIDKAGLRYKLAREDYRVNKILKTDFVEAKKEKMKADYEFFKVKEELKSIKRRLYDMAGLSDG